MGEHASSSDCDLIAKLFVNIAHEAVTILQVTKILIQQELHKHANSPQNVFRANSFCAKFLGVFVRTLTLVKLSNNKSLSCKV